MRMKRMFSKKKKANNIATVHDSKVMATIEEAAADNDFQNNPKSNSKKKSRNRKKRKGRNQKGANSGKGVDQAPFPTVPQIAYRGQDGTRVTIEESRYRNDEIAPNTVLRRNVRADEKRIPGSESSSRTASSASSSSQTKSERRPWSLIDSSRGQSLTDLTNEADFAREFSNIPNLNHHHHMTAPTVCTLPRGIGLEEEFGKRSRNRTFTLDFSFFRRFKRSSMLSGSSHDKRLSSSQIHLPQDTKDRESFSIKSMKKSRKSKKQKNDENSPQHPSALPKNDSYDSSNRKSLLSGSESLLPVRESVLEEALTPTSSPNKVYPSCSEASSSSRASVSTVVGATDQISQCSQFFQQDVTDLSSSAHNSVESRRASAGSGKYEQCEKQRAGARRSVCHCLSNEAETSSIVKARTSLSQTELSTASQSTSNVNGRLTFSLVDFDEDPCFARTSTPKSKIGGSMKDLNQKSRKTSLKASKTAPECKNADKKSRFFVLSPKGSAPYASSPQVNVPKVEVVNIPIERPKASSVKIKFKEEKLRVQPFSEPLPDLQSFSSNSSADSPVKRAIAYTGVVMRRHQNRSAKEKPDFAIVQSSSNNLMARDERAKHVMSLNVEDLPTYEKMREQARWKTTSTKEPCRTSTEPSHLENWDLETIFARQCANLCTSAEDLRNLRSVQGHSIEDITNMDDDEFLDFYLSSLSSNNVAQDMKLQQEEQDGGSKRVKTIRKSVASFANLISPGKPGKKVQRSSSFKESSGTATKQIRPPGHNNSGGSSGSGVLASYCPPGKRGKRTNPKHRRSKLWCETFDHSGLADGELKRQEAIFELYQGERIMVDDLKMAKKTYRDSMVTLKMLNEDEVSRIFGKLDCLLPLHEDLLSRLEKTRTKDGKTDGVGHVFIEWFPTLSPYNEYCANQADAKETLDAVVTREDRVRDFLQRCLESPFSRKLDLWSYLDLPRSRLVKYPLLLKAIHKVTPPNHPDSSLLAKAIDVINDTIARVDQLTGERQANFVKSKLEYLDHKQRSPEVEISRKIICSGQLKTNRGPKLQVFLFDHALVLTRNATRDDKLTYQVYRQPLPLKTMIVETEEGGKLSGSLRGGILSSDKAKYSFRVKSEEISVSHTLIATDEHDKKQWVNSLQEAINHCRMKDDECASLPPPVAPRRGSSQKIKSSDLKKDSASVKRSSSVKSESGSSGSWYRSRSVTLSGLSGRRNSKEKKEMANGLKKSKLSPPSTRRNSKPTLLDTLTSGDFSQRKLSVGEKTDWQRSRSLTSSPIAFLAHLPRRLPRSGSGLKRSESCYSKPPKGRVSNIVRQYSSRNPSGRTPPRSPSISATRSIPDIPSYERRRSNSEHALTLEAVRNRLAMVESSSSVTLSESMVEENLTVSHSYNDTLASNSSLTNESQTSINSASSSQASSTSSRRGSSKAPLLTSSYNSVPMHTSCSSPNILQSVRIPAIAWAPPTDEESSESARSSCSSSTSLDVPTAMDDVEGILESACEDHHNKDGFRESDDVTGDVKDTLNGILDRISESSQPCGAKLPPILTVTCSADYITITSDDGLPWQGNDAQMAV